jgi:hypothetical protein
MNPLAKGFLIVLASALGTGSALATTIVVGGGRVPTTLDLWVISLGVLTNVATTSLALLTQSPIPRKEWTEEERAAKVAATAIPQPKGNPT